MRSFFFFDMDRKQSDQTFDFGRQMCILLCQNKYIWFVSCVCVGCLPAWQHATDSQTVKCWNHFFFCLFVCLEFAFFGNGNGFIMNSWPLTKLLLPAAFPSRGQVEQEMWVCCQLAHLDGSIPYCSSSLPNYSVLLSPLTAHIDSSLLAPSHCCQITAFYLCLSCCDLQLFPIQKVCICLEWFFFLWLHVCLSFSFFSFLFKHQCRRCNFSAREHRLLTLISFSLLYSVAATLGFHRRSIPLSFFMYTALGIFPTKTPSHLFPSPVCGELFLSSPSFPHLCSCQTVQGRKKVRHIYAAVWCSPTGLARVHSPFPSSPPVHFFTRLSDLSLRTMHPSPVPDAEAHGKDRNKRPEQLHLPNGEAPLCLSALVHLPIYCSNASRKLWIDSAVQCVKLPIRGPTQCQSL